MTLNQNIYARPQKRIMDSPKQKKHGWADPLKTYGWPNTNYSIQARILRRLLKKGKVIARDALATTASKNSDCH